MTDTQAKAEQFADFLQKIEHKTVEAMKFLGPVWDLANTETKVRLIFEDLLIRAKCYDCNGDVAPEGIAIIAAALEEVRPVMRDGWVGVPKKPTYRMMSAFMDKLTTYQGGAYKAENFRDAYNNLLDSILFPKDIRTDQHVRNEALEEAASYHDVEATLWHSTGEPEYAKNVKHHLNSAKSIRALKTEGK